MCSTLPWPSTCLPQSQVSTMNRALYLAVLRVEERLGGLGFALCHALPIQSNDHQNSMRITECLPEKSSICSTDREYTRRQTLISSKKHKLQHAGLWQSHSYPICLKPVLIEVPFSKTHRLFPEKYEKC